MKSISFLHFSDLHLGLNSQNTLLSKFRNDLFQDIRKVHSYTGGWDIVFFTGDFVQSGKKEEYEQVTIFLKELWGVFKELGCEPLFIGVPGNHDLERTGNKFDSKLQYLLKWGEDSDFSDDFFWNSENEYKTFIDERFKNYTEWHQELDLPKPTNKIFTGYLPGDFACMMEINDIKIGCACLNSSFLQLNGDDFYEKLDINSNQLQHLFRDRYVDWVKSVDIPLLVTHQPPGWLSPISKKNFDQEIYFPDSFISHFCGHMHEPDLKQSESLISTPRKTQIAPSLFGLEKNENGWSRVHGYFAGKFELSENYIDEIIYPRIMIESFDGSNKIVPDARFDLIDDRYIKFHVKKFDNIVDNEASSSQKESASQDTIANENLFVLNPQKGDALTRTFYIANEAHKSIRSMERERAVGNLSSNNKLWLVTKWGLCEDEFIGTILKLCDINEFNCFSINCIDARNSVEFQNLFFEYFQLSFTNVISILSELDRPLLVLNKVSPELCDIRKSLPQFLSLIKSICDFAPNLKIIISTEQEPINIDYIELSPLDVPSVRSYIKAHQLNSSELSNPFAIEKIHRLSSGFPVSIDSLLDQLKFCNLSELANIEEHSIKDTSTSSNSFIQAIEKLSKSEDITDERSFFLLKILCLLPYGETFDRLKRFYPTKPFFPTNVSKLSTLHLIDFTPINPISFSKGQDTDTIKLIKVIKPIRDYILQLLQKDEKELIYKHACDLYLGDNWRSSQFSIKINKQSIFELTPIIYANVYHSITYLLKNAIELERPVDMERFASICVSFCKHLFDHKQYKECANYSEEIFTILQSTASKTSQVHIAKIYGEACRMNEDLSHKTVSMLEYALLEGDNILSNSDKASIHLDLAYFYGEEDTKELATQHANEVKKYSTKNDAHFIGADMVLINLENDDELKIKKLKQLLRKAKKIKDQIMTSNIIIVLSSLFDNADEKIKSLDSVISASKSPVFHSYNTIRATVLKYEVILLSEKKVDLSLNDIILLNQSYTYLFYQNFIYLFDSCHELLWTYLEAHNDYDQLLNLFRHSSFFWRIRGDEEKEKQYLARFAGNYIINSIQVHITSNYNYFNQRVKDLNS